MKKTLFLFLGIFNLYFAQNTIQSDSINQFAFPRYCNEQSQNSYSASAAFNKWLRTHTFEGCAVHSFRHAMRNRVRAVECPKEIIDQIGGWSTSNVGENYGDGYQMKVLTKWIAKMP